MAYNLIEDKIIQTDAGTLTLPGVLSQMASGNIQSFTSLRPHQRPAWHMFLCQIAAIAMNKVDLKEIPEEETVWRNLLRSLTSDFPNDEPWCLISDDDSPAFLQPVCGPTLGDNLKMTPDHLDMVITSKNHDLKASILQEASPDDWVFALVSLQTMEGYIGVGHFGTARMNGGNSSRPFIGLAPAQKDSTNINMSSWWRHDVSRLLVDRFKSDNPALLWTIPWVKDSQLTLDNIHPLFIEICRRVRLFSADDKIFAKTGTSKKTRVEAKDAKGVTGDPWAPVHIKDRKNMTLGEKRSWTYKLICDLLYSGEWEIPYLSEIPDGSNENFVLVLEAFARGNSKTNGFRSRQIPISQKSVKKLFTVDSMNVSKLLLEDIAVVENTLRNALILMSFSGDLSKIDKNSLYSKRISDNEEDRQADFDANKIISKEAMSKENIISPYIKEFNDYVEGRFFDVLWEVIGHDDANERSKSRAKFMKEISDIAKSTCKVNFATIPCKTALRYRAEARSTNMINKGLRFCLENRDLHKFVQ